MKKTIFLICVAILFAGCKGNKQTESTLKFGIPHLYFNGDIITMHTNMPEYVEALIEKNGKIIFTGTIQEADSKFPQSIKIDLGGQTMLPGFIDPHSHFGMVSNTMGQVDLNPKPVGNVTTISDITEKLKSYKIENHIPDGEWIFGWGYDDGQLAEERHPSKGEIDAAINKNPVYLQHTSGHMGVANTMALEIMNVSSKTEDPEGGAIGRMANSTEPNGLVQETAMYPFVGNMLQILAKNQDNYFNATQEYYISNGITTAQDGMTDRNNIAYFRTQAEAGKLKMDLIALAGYSDLNENLNDSLLQFKTYNNRFKVQGTKIIADGSPQGKTAYFTKPYKTQVPGCLANCKGLPSLSQESLNDLFVMAYAANNQLFIHANGDAAIDMTIAAHEYACQQLNQPLNKDRRTIVVHSQFVRPTQLETYKKYNIEPSLFTNHAYFWGDVHLENLGKKRAEFLSPLVSAINLGLKPTNHSDATVTPIHPMFTVWTAVNRISRSGVIIGQAEKATPYQALQAITIYAAYQIFEDHLKGSLTEGKLADFVILDKNPLKVDPMHIKDIRVVKTIKEGETIFNK